MQAYTSSPELSRTKRIVILPMSLVLAMPVMDAPQVQSFFRMSDSGRVVASSTHSRLRSQMDCIDHIFWSVIGIGISARCQIGFLSWRGERAPWPSRWLADCGRHSFRHLRKPIAGGVCLIDCNQNAPGHPLPYLWNGPALAAWPDSRAQPARQVLRYR
jgi:hypothetical protein